MQKQVHVGCTLSYDAKENALVYHCKYEHPSRYSCSLVPGRSRSTWEEGWGGTPGTDTHTHIYVHIYYIYVYLNVYTMEGMFNSENNCAFYLLFCEMWPSMHKPTIHRTTSKFNFLYHRLTELFVITTMFLFFHSPFCSQVIRR